MLEATACLGGIAFNRQSATQRVVVTANYMLVGSDHYDGGPTVRRLSFSSVVAEHVLRLWARPDYKEVRHRKLGGAQFERPVLHKQVASYIDLGHKIRIRAFRPTVPNTTIEPTSLWIIDFLKLVTPRRALGVLHEFRILLTLICGEPIDLWDVQLAHKVEAEYTHSELYFADPVKRPTTSLGFPTLPTLDIGHDRDLFRRIISGWLSDVPARRVSRAAFYEILQDRGSLRFSHLRELVTIIEMLASSTEAAPLSKGQSAALRDALKKVLNDFAGKEANSDKWRVTIEKRIDHINAHDAKIVLNNFISELPPGIVSVPESFHSEVIDFRNTLVHDMSRIESRDYNKLAFFVAKLKALYVLSDAIALGASIGEVRKGASFFMAAEHMPLNSFSDDGD
jgi:ApeA N-terminal domain 1